MRLLPSAAGSIAGAYAGLHVPPQVRHGAFAPGLLAVSVLALAFLGFLGWRGFLGAGPSGLRASGLPGRLGALVAFPLAVVCATAAMAMVHANAAQPQWLLAAAEGGQTARIEAVVRGRTEAEAWSSEGQCAADLSLTSIESRVLGSHSWGNAGFGALDAGHLREALRHSVLPVVIHADGLPCDARQGQRIESAARLAPARPGNRAAARAHLSHPQVSGPGSVHGRVVAEIGASLTRLLEPLAAHAQGLVPGVALGDDSRVAPDLSEAMRLAQLTHLVAVSGGHVSIVTGIVLLAVGRRRAARAAVSAAVALAALVALVGTHASVVRAALMDVVVLAALALRRPTQAIASLAAAVIIAGLANPWLAISYGFLLSAAATAGIVLLGKPLSARLEEHVDALFPSSAATRRIPVAGIADAVAISLAAQLACSPILLMFTDTGSVWGVLANVLVAPVVAPLTVFGLAAALLAPVAPSVAALVLLPSAACTWWISCVATTLAAWPGSGIGAVQAALVTLGEAWAIAVAQPRAGSRKRPVAVLLVAFLAVFAYGAHRSFQARIPTHWQAIVCDVGQGSAFLARTEAGIVMVDVGPEDGGADRCLAQAGVETIDLLVLSHFHDDHIGGLADVLARANVRQAWVSPDGEPRDEARETLRLLEDRSIPFRQVRRGERLEGPAGHAAVTVLNPGPVLRHDPNADCLVVTIDAAGGALVMGDADGDVQLDIARETGRVRTLVVAHHGSARQSPRLAQAALPDLAVISVGENAYGHPSRQALETYRDAQILDTRTDGTIVLTDPSSPPRLVPQTRRRR